MSSMWRVAAFLPALLGIAPSTSALYGQSAYTPYAYPQTVYGQQSVSASIGDWRRLRQSSGYAFSDYARFLILNPGWPRESTIRGWAEKAMRPGENSATVLAFFASKQPTTGNGFARLADAYAATGRGGEALAAAKAAWGCADLSATDEQALYARYGGSLTAADNDRRADALLFAKDAADAQRFLASTSPQRRAAFAARIAMQTGADNVDALYQAVLGSVTTDAGLMMDRARYLRSKGYDEAAQQLAARPHSFTYQPADVERFYAMLLSLANDAAQDRNWSTAFAITSHLSDALPAGTDIAAQSIDIRDDYTSLVWLGGTIALDRLNRPSSAMAMFYNYANGGKSLQVQTKGYYWAGRAALAAGNWQQANGYFIQAAAYPELFYGQLALERLGRTVSAPAQALPQFTTPQAARTAFNSRRLVQAVRIMSSAGTAEERGLFVQALAQSLDNDTDRGLAVELGTQIGRSDLPVWVARTARVKGSMFYVRQAYPTLASASLPPTIWSLAQGITRQESSFDPYAVSHAGAYGMMQLMPGTAREQAGKLGIGYDTSRLSTDGSYNVMLGSAYFQRLLDTWGGSVPLAVASYNAGSGNVRRWVNTYGDPRTGQVDMLKWIEAIPYSETKAYVQRVIENSVVYDSLRPQPTQQSALHVSHYLGKSQPG
ncbi:lytic transglycosylase domain-containing protein [Sphingomonas sp.]|uniref:lytic transglycosylase domain-containing protein n=1 Tax=Sphingomonas sp. TaxID=28214 RepID=UPI0025D0C259|nr:lytic transglycosylase domain-containing protein [Sphingomonas sp.]MBV9528473.1 lytic transglycosylase domain-containing protein [Sphingomonas sp.]